VKKKRILIIEDGEELLQVLIARIASAGYDAIGARDGHEGLAILKQQKPDLVVLDLVLPGVSGEDILHAIKGDEELSAMPVIVLTAQLITPRMEERLKRYAGIELISKPYEPAALIKCLERGLSPSGAR